MPVSNEIFDMKNRHLVGKMVFSDRGSALINGIEFPDVRNVFTVTAKDLKKNTMDLCGNEINLLADGKTDFAGQCLFAVFGPDWETVNGYVRNTKISYGNIETHAPEVVFTKKSKEGNLPEGNFNTVRSELRVDRHSSSLFGNRKVLVCNSDGSLAIKISSQRPVCIKNTVAECLGIPKKEINVFSYEFSAVFDELITGPAIAAVVASCAALKAGNGLVEFTMPMVNSHPQLYFETESRTDDENRVVSTKTVIHADIGAYPVFMEECADSLIVGVSSNYGKQYAETEVIIECSANYPSFYFVDFGFAMALAAEENHMSNLIKSTGEKQSLWRCDNLKNDEQVDSGKTIQLISEVVEVSKFDRQNAVNRQIHHLGDDVSPLLSYARGISLACGSGIRNCPYPLILEDAVKNISDAKLLPGVSAALVLSLHIDRVMTVPVIDNVWVKVNCVADQNEKIIENTLGCIINNTISELCPCAVHKHGTNIEINGNPDGVNAWAKSVVRGLTASCLSYALSQALGFTVNRFPVYESSIINVIEQRSRARKVDNETDNDNRR